MMFTYRAITATEAREFHRQHFSGAFPAHKAWIMVHGLQYVPTRAAFLIAGEGGLSGIVSVKAAKEAEVAA